LQFGDRQTDKQTNRRTDGQHCRERRLNNMDMRHYRKSAAITSATRLQVVN